MVAKKLTLLNASILTNFGTYIFEPLTLEEARALVGGFQREGKSIQSFIGHAATAELLSDLFGVAVAVNRGSHHQTLEDIALIFILNERPGEGKVLNREELERIGYGFGLLTRKS